MNRISAEEIAQRLLMGLKETFGDRLLLVAFVGSWVRGEGRSDSDVDFNVVLDTVGTGDLLEYRRIVETCSKPGDACGFLVGRDELPVWPAFDRTSFHFGSRILHGSLDGLIPIPTKDDLRDYISITIPQLNHAVRHRIIYSQDPVIAAEKMKVAYKTAYFVLQAWMLLTRGIFYPTRVSIFEAVDHDLDIGILSRLMTWEEDENLRSSDPLGTLNLYETWTKSMLMRLESSFSLN